MLHVGATLTTLIMCALSRRTSKLTCSVRQHARPFDAVALWWVFEQRGRNDRLPGAYRRLYCDACLATADRKIRPRAEITREPPDAEQPPYPDQPTWPRLVSRYRS